MLMSYIFVTEYQASNLTYHHRCHVEKHIFLHPFEEHLTIWGTADYVPCLLSKEILERKAKIKKMSSSYIGSENRLWSFLNRAETINHSRGRNR
jgi:hypothetical protein